ncbi:MAG: T9SS type A sorting domain-containing protein, partial [Mariniphaga sp.]
HEAWNSCFGNYANMTIESMDIANISDNPLFEGIVANPTHPYTLLSSSPCIDSGDDSYSFETTDIRGGTYSRKLDKSTGAEGTIDMGAYEYNINNYWSGATSTTWNDDTNWNSGKAPTSSDRIVIPSSPSNQPHVTDPATAPAVCLDLTIQSGAVVTVDAGKALSVSGNLTNFAGTSGLVVKSDDGGTGSLKILGSVSGSATVERNFSIDKWHLVSSPLASEPIITFLANNVDIATSDLASASHYEYAMSSYSAGSWSSFFLHDKSNLDLFGVGKGYRVLTSIPFTKTTYFEGTLNSLPVSAVPVELGWNLVGNPYTTALNINAGSTGFVSVNSALLPSSFAAVYFWDAATTAYIAVNNDFADTNAPIGQGFFVKAGSAGNITFNSDMQIHDGSNVFKSSSLTRPTITLKANNGIGTASTLIKFMDGAHEGLDVGYDAGIFKADAEFTVYTKLVEDNGVEFQLQYLPTNQYSKLVIPVGIDSKAGGEIVFTVQTVQLDPTCKVILEDKLTNTFTDLSKNSYKAAVVANTSTSERFFLHTGDIVSGLEDQVLPGKVTAYAKGNTEIRVIGEVGEGAVATLVNGLGQVVLTKKLGAGSLNIIGLPYLSSGVYLLNINDKSTSQTIKVMVRK